MNKQDYMSKAIEAQLDNYEKAKTMHLVHLILSLCTGLWIVVWIFCYLNNKVKQQEALDEIRGMVTVNKGSEEFDNAN